MDRHSDFNKQAIVHGGQIDWISSPANGVSRKMLDRIGGEVARATTIVRFDAGSSFAPHVHGGGEEFLVLEGIFQDEHGDYPAGSYIRNPPTSEHRPRSDQGCIILVKLWQFDPEDRQFVIQHKNSVEAFIDPLRKGVTIKPLYQDENETVRIENWKAEGEITLGAPGGAEYFLLEGSFTLNGEIFSPYSWLRLPDNQTVSVKVGVEEAVLWSKTGHLRSIHLPHD